MVTLFAISFRPSPRPSPASGEREFSRPHPLTAARAEFDRAVGNGDAEGRPDGALDEPDLAAVRAHQLGRDGAPQPRTARAGRARERLEQMGARLGGHARPGVRDLDHHYGALAPADDADVVARRIVG